MELSRCVLPRRWVRRLDRLAIEQFGVPGIVLMENAGRGAAEWLAEHVKRGPVVICCGKGNNGGDGLVIARHLDNRGIDVHIALLVPAQSLSGDAATNWSIVQRSRLDAAYYELADIARRAAFSERLTAAEWIVDALLGTGAQGEIREPYATAIEALDAAERPVLAVDLPSGLDCDTGEPLGPCVRATLTATFAATKPGLIRESARQWTGRLRVFDIGAPRAAYRVLAEEMRSAGEQPPPLDGN
ncbi:MAG: NAD(P)H-hydrate epimerase [Planctomycetota bacterium]|nr:MAG: NAD(P)H-hydrate epimerase [Planctomycetota bacterium]